MAVEIRNLTKRFRGRGIVPSEKNSFLAVDNVSFSIEKNTIYGLVGESGSGKTTVARSLLYLDPPTSGTVRIDDTEINTLSRSELRRRRSAMQIIFQDPNAALNPKLTIDKSLEEGLVNRGVLQEERQRRISELLELVGISPTHRNRYPHEFSGGQKQRIVIARALSMDPEFLILDEPVSNLDVSIQAQIINLLLDLKEKFSLTYLFISHDLNLVSYLSDRIGVMYAGRIVEEGPAESIIENPRHPYTIHLFSSVSGATLRFKEATPGRSGARHDEETEGSEGTGCGYYGRCPLQTSECRSRRPEQKEVEPRHFVACIHSDYTRRSI